MLPYVPDESHNPYASDEPPPAESERVVPEAASPMYFSSLSDNALADTLAESPPVNEADRVYASPSSGTFAPAGAGVPATPLSPPSLRSNKRHALFWFAMGSLSMLLLGTILSASGYFLYSYLNRSTPMKTLDAFCEALQREDYENAYDHFSRRYQDTLTEADFASVLSMDKIVGCSHGAADDVKTVISTNLKLVHNSQGVNDDIVTLTKDANNNWKINDLRNAQ
jgi:hypothetical protein